MRVLLVEQSPELSEAIETALSLEGWSVRRTMSGRDGLLALARERPDAVLLDLQVEDLSALAVTRAVSDFADLPVVVMSWEAGDWRREAFEGGAAACLRKPFALDDLVRLLRSLAEKRNGGSVWPGEVDALGPADLRRLGRLTREELDALPFGAIQLDREGRVVEFNDYEAKASGYHRATVLGLRFHQVAPCTSVREFLQAIEEANAVGHIDRVMRFTFPHGAARVLVNLRLYCDAGRLWLFVSRLVQEPRTSSAGAPRRPT